MRIGLGDQNHQIWSPVTARTPAGVLVDLSTSTVQFAFTTPSVRPGVSDWKNGSWVDGYPSYSLTPAGIPLTVGLWDVWLKITLGSVVIEVRIDQITIA